MHRIACFGFLATPPIAFPLVHTNSNTALAPGVSPGARFTPGAYALRLAVGD
ncbi:hypothetical protein Mal64_09320 [Pseudobythopirellula maris]|uniref:Uncharacterized protein n=1 Tax=Pseudobythopirellula maris TaxID=2527991 RepID=A0A5C5ZTH0_9BACT|nr:hypothetical protein Mal64_09320 [Pseudobythopirellula maris]